MDLISRAVVVPALASWLSALDGAARLETGGAVADVGCGYGAPTIAMAQAFPRSCFLGIDVDDGSVARARKAAAEAGLGGRVAFEVADAAGLTGRDYDLVTFFDCLHDLGDPVGALRRARAYKARLTELDQDISDATTNNDPERAARAAAERDALIGELTHALGLGGRSRRLGDDSERARKAVAARIHHAIDRLQRYHPDLAAHLRTAIRTGAACTYQPAQPVDWNQ